MENKEFCLGGMSIAELMHHAVDQTKILVTESVEDDVDNTAEEDLTHAGIKGMKWGIRRYQNKDGSLTPAGKKRYNKELSKVRESEKILKNKQATKAKIEKLNARKKAVSEGEKEIEGFYSKDKTTKAKKTSKPADSNTEKKSIKDMSDDDLRKAKTRLELERDYLKVYNELNPKKVSAGKEFIKKLGKNLGDAAAEATKNAGKAFIEKQLRAMLGVPEKNDGDKNKNKNNNNKKDKVLSKDEQKLADLKARKEAYEVRQQLDALSKQESNNWKPPDTRSKDEKILDGLNEKIKKITTEKATKEAIETARKTLEDLKNANSNK